MAKLKVLVIAELDTIGHLISIMLRRGGFDVTVVDSFRPIEETLAETHTELSRNQYDVLVPTSNGLPPRKILELIREVKGEISGYQNHGVSSLGGTGILKGSERASY
jgi:DNA-binding response OmpR family regulator